MEKKMRVRRNISFPHPLLSEESSDYQDSSFILEITVSEQVDSSSIQLHTELSLDEPGIKKLYDNDEVALAIMVNCLDTFYDEFIEIPFGKYEHVFEDGTLRGRTYVRAIIATKQRVLLESPRLNEEFQEVKLEIGAGQILALSAEYSFVAGFEKLAPMSSILSLAEHSSMDEGIFDIDVEGETIKIYVGPETYASIYHIRGLPNIRRLLVSSLFLPVLIAALDFMRDETFSSRRWFAILKAKCENLGITLDLSTNLAIEAQKILNQPLGELNKVVKELSS